LAVADPLQDLPAELRRKRQPAFVHGTSPEWTQDDLQDLLRSRLREHAFIMDTTKVTDPTSLFYFAAAWNAAEFGN
jgi:hypothetical protein